MSVTFSIRGLGSLFDEEGNETGVPYVNFSNANARRLLLELKLPGVNESQPRGSVRGKELREVCERHFANPVPELDRARPESFEDNFIQFAQHEGHFTERVEKLLELAKFAGDLGVIEYG